uniref:Putative secreted protein n=1 Tax=Anopheles marajoara TaxID=58244 RepID=A0A2M4CDY2_9DIPT
MMQQFGFCQKSSPLLWVTLLHCVSSWAHGPIRLDLSGSKYRDYHLAARCLIDEVVGPERERERERYYSLIL